MNINYIWPVALVVVSNSAYHLIAKQTPSKASPFLSLTVTYLVGAFISVLLYFIFNHGNTITENIKTLNWTSFALGLAVIGLEAGYILVYRAGWPIGTGSLVANICLAVVLIVLGAVCFKEHVSMKQYIGMALCVTGLIFVNI